MDLQADNGGPESEARETILARASARLAGGPALTASGGLLDAVGRATAVGGNRPLTDSLLRRRQSPGGGSAWGSPDFVFRLPRGVVAAERAQGFTEREGPLAPRPGAARLRRAASAGHESPQSPAGAAEEPLLARRSAAAQHDVRAVRPLQAGGQASNEIANRRPMVEPDGAADAGSRSSVRLAEPPRAGAGVDAQGSRAGAVPRGQRVLRRLRVRDPELPSDLVRAETAHGATEVEVARSARRNPLRRSRPHVPDRPAAASGRTTTSEDTTAGGTRSGEGTTSGEPQRPGTAVPFAPAAEPSAAQVTSRAGGQPATAASPSAPVEVQAPPSRVRRLLRRARAGDVELPGPADVSAPAASGRTGTDTSSVRADAASAGHRETGIALSRAHAASGRTGTDTSSAWAAAAPAGHRETGIALSRAHAASGRTGTDTSSARAAAAPAGHQDTGIALSRATAVVPAAAAGRATGSHLQHVVGESQPGVDAAPEAARPRSTRSGQAAGATAIRRVLRVGAPLTGAPAETVAAAPSRQMNAHPSATPVDHVADPSLGRRVSRVGAPLVAADERATPTPVPQTMSPPTPPLDLASTAFEPPRDQQPNGGASAHAVLRRALVLPPTRVAQRAPGSAPGGSSPNNGGAVPEVDPASTPTSASSASTSRADATVDTAALAERVYDLICDRLVRERERRGLW